MALEYDPSPGPLAAAGTVHMEAAMHVAKNRFFMGWKINGG
jgi:hypothetical protein